MAQCIVCLKSCPAAAGNYNIDKPALCSKLCRRIRKTELQAFRRSQLKLKVEEVPIEEKRVNGEAR